MGRPRKANVSLEELRSLRERGYTNAVIGQLYGISAKTVTMMMNPDSYRRQSEYQARLRAQQPKKQKQEKAKPFDLPENPTIEDYMLPRQRVKVEGILPPPDTRTLTGKLLGDPMPGRSALDRMLERA